MSTENIFNLKIAIHQWENSFREINTDIEGCIEELVSHLHDSMAEFRNKGFSEEEAFQLASSELGQVPSIVVEFSKNHTVEGFDVIRFSVFFATWIFLSGILYYYGFFKELGFHIGCCVGILVSWVFLETLPLLKKRGGLINKFDKLRFIFSAFILFSFVSILVYLGLYDMFQLMPGYLVASIFACVLGEFMLLFVGKQRLKLTCSMA
ncbi:MAG: hypothetical protein COA79_26630 [Planctomycetota bacterium]|nr:MAG: hypothetical protein COA79_26630 [Planctomycetota bacterium]